mgnify:CR=1 FL=1
MEREAKSRVRLPPAPGQCGRFPHHALNVHAHTEHTHTRIDARMHARTRTHMPFRAAHSSRYAR